MASPRLGTKDKKLLKAAGLLDKYYVTYENFKKKGFRAEEAHDKALKIYLKEAREAIEAGEIDIPDGLSESEEEYERIRKALQENMPTITPDMFKNKKKSTVLEDMDWAYQVLPYEPKDIDWSTMPGPGAASWYKFGKLYGFEDFMKQYATKKIAAESANEDDSLVDDRRKLTSLIERCESFHLATESRGVGGNQPKNIGGVPLLPSGAKGASS